MTSKTLLGLLSPVTFALASCGAAATGEKASASEEGASAFTVETLAGFDEPWAMDVDPETGIAIITEKAGAIRLYLPDGSKGTVSGAPRVAYSGQGGLGDVRLAPASVDEGASDGPGLDGRMVYLSWAEAGDGDTRGAALGRGRLSCSAAANCTLDDFSVIWRQQPKVTGSGHYSHRIAFSPDGQYLFVSSGERQKQEPAQDLTNTLGTIVRLLPDGTPAPDNPFADKGSPSDQIWSYGHRNMLGLAFAPDDRLWVLEHGPAGGDELNLVKPGQNYGWPLVSDGDHYDGKPIDRHETRPDLAAPAISWNPVIAPGDFIFYTGTAFPEWQGNVIIASFSLPGLVRLSIDGDSAAEEARYTLENRIREVRQANDGSLWLLEDGKAPDSGHLLRLTPASSAD